MIYPFFIISGQLLHTNKNSTNVTTLENVRILCIEDEPEMIELIGLILSRRGFQVEGANSGELGIQKAKETPPDIILLDLMMPGKDGWDVFQELKSHPTTNKIPVIVVTAKAHNIDKVLGLHIAKVDDYIAKPFSPKELILSVEKTLKKQGSNGAA